MAQLGDGVGSGYPGVLDTSTTEGNDPGGTVIDADKTNDVTAAIIAIQTELGVDPAGLSSNVVIRLNNLPFVIGTVVCFFQAAAPTGWTQVTTQNDKALRVVSGTGGGTGGTVAFETAFTSQAISGTNTGTTATGTNTGTAITTAQLAAHVHTPQLFNTGSGGHGGGAFSSNQISVGTTTSTGSGSTHTHTFTGNSHTHTFSGTNVDLNVSFINIILASQD